MAEGRDAELRAVTIGEPTRVDGAIRLAEPDPSWPGLFAREAARIRGLLGDRVLLLEHVGSTSVPGLGAKPIIDIVLGVADSGRRGGLRPVARGGGYVLRVREPEWFEHRMFKGPDTDVNLHVFVSDSPEIDRMVAFREVRSDDDEADRYEADQARPRGPRLDLRPGLRGRQERGRRGDHRPGDGLR